MRVFNALNGSELKKILMNEIERALDADPDFRPHLTFPMVRWSWKLEMRVYPRDPEGKSVEASGEVLQAERQPDGTTIDFNPEGKASDRVVISTPERIIDTPDVAREEEGLAVPEAISSMGSQPNFARRVEVGKGAKSPTSIPRQERE
jgi:hypothetical protein